VGLNWSAGKAYNSIAFSIGNQVYQSMNYTKAKKKLYYLTSEQETKEYYIGQGIDNNSSFILNLK
jgi:hypothetical protein